MVAVLIRLFFYRLVGMRARGELLAIVDGTGIRLERASSHYLKQMRGDEILAADSSVRSGNR